MVRERPFGLPSQYNMRPKNKAVNYSKDKSPTGLSLLTDDIEKVDGRKGEWRSF